MFSRSSQNDLEYGCSGADISVYTQGNSTQAISRTRKFHYVRSSISVESMTDQARKHNIGLAGEFLVAGECLRRGFTAAVTYGHAKKADVIVVAGNRAATIEVKTTCEAKWIV